MLFSTDGNTRTEKALELARSTMFTTEKGERQDKPNVCEKPVMFDTNSPLALLTIYVSLNIYE